MHDPYVYAGSEVLINKLGIRHKDDLVRAEGDYTSFRLRFLLENPITGKYDFKHLCKYHEYIFQDLYDWAGKPRTINIEKEEKALGGWSIEYANSNSIESECNQALKRMREYPWRSMDLDGRANAFADSLAKLWKVHPFREGNTRTAVTFTCHFYENQGLSIDKKLFEENSTYVRTALVAYNAVFSDIGDRSQPHFLQRIVKDAIENAEKRPRKKITIKESKDPHRTNSYRKNHGIDL